MAITTTREAAQALASFGVRVFPLGWRSKEPLPRSRGHHDASADLTLTRRRWAGRLLNVGVRTGTEIHSGFLSVLDVDGSAGYETLAELERRHGPLPNTFVVKTSRGEHRYLTGPALPSRIGFLPGLDWKAQGGYVVGPCSVHPNGKVYTCTDWSAPLAAVPGWLLQLVQQKATVDPTPEPVGRVVHEDRYLSCAIAGEARRLRHVTTNRNTSLFCAAVRLRKLIDGRPIDGIAAMIEVELIAAAVDTGLSKDEARKTIRSAMGGRHAS